MLKSSIITKLETLVERFEEVQALLGEAEVIADQDRFRELNKEYSQLETVVGTFRQYKTLSDDLEEINVMINGDDPDMKEMAEAEIDETKAKLEKTEHDIQILLLPKDPKDDNNAFVEIRAGTGGDEAAIFAGDLFRLYSKYSEKKGWSIEIMSCSEGEFSGYKEMIFKVSGQGAYGILNRAVTVCSVCLKLKHRGECTHQLVR